MYFIELNFFLIINKIKSTRNVEEKSSDEVPHLKLFSLQEKRERGSVREEREGFCVLDERALECKLTENSLINLEQFKSNYTHKTRWSKIIKKR